MNNELNISQVQLTSLEGVRSAYFIGIGGIGMSAIARYCVSKKITVSGYDKVRTKLTEELENEGIAIHYSEDVSRISKDVDLVIYTPAVPKDHAELVYFKEHDFKVVKRSDMLQAISNDSFNICVAGTHGKTTISTMIAHILRETDYGCTAFLGGISVNYQTNFWSNKNNVCVIEADEYDRSFLKLNPDVAIVTSMDADHLDIYGDESSMQDAFIAFGNKVKEGGLFINKFGLNRIKEVTVPNKLTYSLQNAGADVYATNIEMEEGGYKFDVLIKGEMISSFKLKIGGMHNVENVIAAIAVSYYLKIDVEKIKSAVANYKGVRRRFEYIIPPLKHKEDEYIKPVLIDDYAHHPEELKALLTSVRSLFAARWITVIFQPHLYSRTRDLADGFAAALSLADQVILLPVYPARELPIPGVSSQLILDKITVSNKKIVTKENLTKELKEQTANEDKRFGNVFVMAGAGDIDTLIPDVKKIIS